MSVERFVCPELGDEDSGGEVVRVKSEHLHMLRGCGVILSELKYLAIDEFDSHRVLLQRLEVSLPSLVYMVEEPADGYFMSRRDGVKAEHDLGDETESSFAAGDEGA